MNTRKQVLAMSALLMLMLITIGIYGAWYPAREDDAEAHFAELTAERGAILFARNCRLCHGDVGEGGALGGRLPSAPALDRPDLEGYLDSQSPTTGAVTATATTIPVTTGSKFRGGSIIQLDDEVMEVQSVSGNNLTVKRAQDHTVAAAHPTDTVVWLFDTSVLEQHVRLITNTITCGRVGSAMPTWGQSQGGPLSDEQIRQLTTVITDRKWDLVKKEVDHEDERTHLTEAVDGNATTIEVADVSVINALEAIRIGDERIRVISKVALGDSLAEKHGILVVERGILGTTPLDHAAEDVVYHFPDAPTDPNILQQACGQFAKANTGGDTTVNRITDFTGGQTVTVVASGVAFDTRSITVNAGGQLLVTLDNRDVGVQHDIGFYQSSTNLTLVAPGAHSATFAGPEIDDTVFTLPAAGSYFFRCDVHPTTMTGTFTVR